MLYCIFTQPHAFMVGHEWMQCLIFAGSLVQFLGMLTPFIVIFFLGKDFRDGERVLFFPLGPAFQIAQEIGGLTGPRKLENNFIGLFMTWAMIARHSVCISVYF